MKRTLFTRIISAAAAVAICATAFVGCGKDDGKCIDGGEHIYTVVKGTEVAATCSSEGHRTEMCANCGDVREVTLPIDPEAHSYGNWDITDPTESADGTAVKTCSLNKQHVYSVVLPAYSLTSTDGYDEHIIEKAPTAASEGTLYLRKDDPNGNIEFRVTVPKRVVNNMDDAITLAVTLGDTVRTSTGYFTERTDGKKNEFNVYFGDDFVRVQETGNNTETWYSYDDEGKIFGVSRDIPTESNPNPPASKDESAVDDNMKGFSYQSGGGDTRVYGAEGLLQNSYKGYLSPEAVLKSEPIFSKNDSDGTVYIEYSFSRFENPRFVRYKVSATLDKTGAILSLTEEVAVIFTYMIATDIDNQPIFKDNGDVEFSKVFIDDGNGGYKPMLDLNGEKMYLKDENGDDVLNSFDQKVPLYQYVPEVQTPLKDINGIKYVVDGDTVKVYACNALGQEAEARYETDEDGNIIYYNGTNIPVTVPTYYSDASDDVNNRKIVYEEQTFKSPDDVVEENQYPSTVLYINSFDVTYDGDIIGEEGVSIPSNQAVTFGITNIQPAGTATLSYDPLSLYIRTEARDIELTMEPTSNSYKMMGYFNRTTNKPTVNAQYAGEVILVLKTKGGLFEKEIKLNFEKSAPTGPSGEFPLKSQVNTYQEIDGVVSYSWNEYTVDNPYKVYTNQPFAVRTAVSEAGASFIDTSFKVYEVTENLNRVGDDVVSYVTNADGTVTFTAKKAGRYNVILRSTISASAMTTFDIVVEEQPAISSMFINGTVYEGHFKYIKTGGGNPAPADVTITVSNNNNWRQGTLKIEVAGNETIYDYSYSEADGKLTATYKSGVNTATFDFSFAINEAYRLTVTHSTGFASMTETIVIAPPAEEGAE